MKVEEDDSDSSDAEFVPSEEQYEEIQNFQFLFPKKSLHSNGKIYRRKLKWLMCFFPTI